MTKHRAPAKRHRSAKHGGYVSAAEAAASPDTTIAETVRPRRKRDPSLRARFAALLPTIRETARSLGYAVAVHGSEERDFDLIAVPWVDKATSAEGLAEAIRAAVNGHIINKPDAPPGDFYHRNPQPKPHGRLAWSIYLTGGGPARFEDGGVCYIDLSVMPLATA